MKADGPVDERLRRALADRADAVTSAADWSAVAQRLHHGPSQGSRRRAFVLGGAAAVLVLLVALVGGFMLRGDDAGDQVTAGPSEAEDAGVDGAEPEPALPPGTGDGPTTPEVGPVVAARPDGSLVELDPVTGEVRREITGAIGAPIGGDADVLLLAELAVAPDGGSAFQSRVTRSARQAGTAGGPCGEQELWVPSDIWRIELDDGRATSLVGDRGAQPSRLPTPSPDGAHLAYVTTSNGERCDGALTVVVAALPAPDDAGSSPDVDDSPDGAPGIDADDAPGVDPGEVVATHSLPVSTDVVELVWLEPDVLALALQPTGGDRLSGSQLTPDGNQEPFTPGLDPDRAAELTPYGKQSPRRVVVVEPLRGGPVDMAGTTELPAPSPGGDVELGRSRMAAGASGAIVQAAPTTPAETPPDAGPDEFERSSTISVWASPALAAPSSEPTWQVDLPDVEAPARILHLAVDASGATWVTVGVGAAAPGAGPEPEGIGTDSRTWRIPAGGVGSVTAVEHGFVAVAASPHIVGG